MQAKEDPPARYFVLARVATMNGDMQGARDNFQKALEAPANPTVAAWSHIYLGRILDMQDEREAAVAEYKAALNAGDTSVALKTAAERGLKAAYQPPNAKPEQ